MGSYGFHVFIYLDFSWFFSGDFIRDEFFYPQKSERRSVWGVGPVGSTSQKDSDIFQTILFVLIINFVEFPEWVSHWVDNFEIHPKRVWEFYSYI